MAEYIEREAAIKEFERYGAEDDAIAVLNSIPAADVRPVVLCRDCYAYKKDPEVARSAYLDPEKYCAILRVEMPESGYCWYGCPNCGASMED